MLVAHGNDDTGEDVDDDQIKAARRRDNIFQTALLDNELVQNAILLGVFLCHLHSKRINVQRDDLRRRLDNSEGAREREAEAREQAALEIRRLTLMITHQQQQKAETEAQAQPAPTPETQPIAKQNNRPASVRPWLWVSLALAVALWLGAYLYFRPQ